MKVVIATRGSRLALAQAEYVRARLAAADPQNCYELKIIKTTGDRVQDRALDALGDKGVFVREIEQALLDGTADLAVHSWKDMPSRLPDELCLAPAWEREDARDALVLRGADSLAALPEHAVIGTGSRRRALQLLALRPDLRIVGIRGNVDTRLRKLEEDGLDGLVLAAAGLKRLGLSSRITQLLSPEQMIPAAAQGALAIELRADRTQLLSVLDRFHEEAAERTVRAERLFLEGTGADCHMPVGAHAEVQPDGSVRLFAFYGEAERILLRCCVVGKTPEEAAASALDKLHKNVL